MRLIKGLYFAGKIPTILYGIYFVSIANAPAIMIKFQKTFGVEMYATPAGRFLIFVKTILSIILSQQKANQLKHLQQYYHKAKGIVSIILYSYTESYIACSVPAIRLNLCTGL